MQNHKCEFSVGESEACRMMWERKTLTGEVLKEAEGKKVREG